MRQKRLNKNYIVYNDKRVNSLRTHKMVKQILIELKGEINNNVLSTMNRTSTEKNNKEISDYRSNGSNSYIHNFSCR